jgi:hypothetical protein
MNKQHVYTTNPHSLAGEAMEAALRECCQGIKIGKILVHRRVMMGEGEGRIPCETGMGCIEWHHWEDPGAQASEEGRGFGGLVHRMVSCHTSALSQVC